MGTLFWVIAAIILGIVLIIFLLAAFIDFIVERMLMGKFSTTYWQTVKNKIKKMFYIDI